MIEEIFALKAYKPVKKDIIIVVRNQLYHVRNCIESIIKNTKDFNLFIWDNASNEETADYLQSVNAFYHREEENIGFIIPNNRLAAIGRSPYIILLNSDTIVSKGWDHLLLSWMQLHTDVAVTGYCGSKLTEQFKGLQACAGYEADFICGWCMAFPRKIYEEHGLFDENLKFAYGEDSDFCLKIKQAGYKTYSLHLTYVEHVGHCTIKAEDAAGHHDKLLETFTENHKYLKEKWGNSPLIQPMSK